MTLSARAGLTVIAVAALAAGVLAHLGAGRTSATFDEIVLVSGGLRGIEEQRWDMVTDQPPLMMYSYGLAARSASPVRPAEDRAWLFDDRWDYARDLFFRQGNDPTELLARARVVASVLATVLVAAVGAADARRRVIELGEDVWQQWTWLADLPARVGDPDGALAALQSARERAVTDEDRVQVESFAVQLMDSLAVSGR